MSRQEGFTLVEIIVTMAIAAIVLTLGVPSFQSYIQNSRKTTAINELATALQLARNSAISQRVRTTVCKSPDGLNCLPNGAASDWGQGWIVFADDNGDNIVDATDGNNVVDLGETILRVHDTIDSDSSVNFTGNNNVINQVSFTARGIALGSNGTIRHCDSRGDTFAKALVISLSGQVRQAVDDGGDGIVDIDGTNGTNVSCP